MKNKMVNPKRHVIMREPHLTEDQKNKIIRFVERKMLGREILSSESSEVEINNVINNEYYLGSVEDDIRKSLKEGKSIYYGSIDFSDTYGLEYLMRGIWNELDADDFINLDIE